MDKEIIQEFLKDKIKNILNISITDNSSNLFSSGISAYDMLYITEEIENQYKVSSENLFGNSEYDMMTIDILASTISKKLNI